MWLIKAKCIDCSNAGVTQPEESQEITVFKGQETAREILKSQVAS